MSNLVLTGALGRFVERCPLLEELHLRQWDLRGVGGGASDRRSETRLSSRSDSVQHYNGASRTHDMDIEIP